MRYGMNDIEAKKPRNHPVILWEAENLHNDFTDISRMALDPRYGHNAAPLSKRRTGTGPTDGSTPGLFGAGMSGLINYRTQKSAFYAGMITAAGAYATVDWYLNQGHGLTGWKRRVARSPITASLLVLSALAVAPSD